MKSRRGVSRNFICARRGVPTHGPDARHKIALARAPESLQSTSTLGWRRQHRWGRPRSGLLCRLAVEQIDPWGPQLGMPSAFRFYW